MRPKLLELLTLGPMPPAETTNSEIIDRYSQLIESLRPASNEEAKVLISIFGDDDFNGVAWSLLHLIESAPDWPDMEFLASISDPPNSKARWVEFLKLRIQNKKHSP